MTGTKPKLFQAERFSHMMYSTPIALQASVLFLAAFFNCVLPNAGMLELSKSETPVEQRETSEESVVRLRTGTRWSVSRERVALSVLMFDGLKVRDSEQVRSRKAGHRLSNNLLAPLRC